MRALFNAKEVLLESYRHRFARLRGEAPGGNWVGIEDFGLPLNEELPDVCRLSPQASATGNAAGTSATVPAATNQE
jgi:hypothetical protein